MSRLGQDGTTPAHAGVVNANVERLCPSHSGMAIAIWGGAPPVTGHDSKPLDPMTKTQVQHHAKSFIASAKLKDWNQESHSAFQAYILKQLLSTTKPGPADKEGKPGAEVPIVMADLPKLWLALGSEFPALLTNASAFRQWLQSDKVALLAKAESDEPANRYGNLI